MPLLSLPDEEATTSVDMSDGVLRAVAPIHATGQPFSLLLFDIDNFKSINDTFGHDEGDRILVKLVEVVQTALRESDQLGRWGARNSWYWHPRHP